MYGAGYSKLRYGTDRSSSMASHVYVLLSDVYFVYHAHFCVSCIVDSYFVLRTNHTKYADSNLNKKLLLKMHYNLYFITFKEVIKSNMKIMNELTHSNALKVEQE